jgi:myo-inositol-1(or 4)-monophosphatase
MMTRSTPFDLGDDLAELVKSIMLEIRPKLLESALSGDHRENPNLRHTDNFLSAHDMWMHERYLGLLTPRLGSFVYASEEAEPQVVGPDSQPDLCVLVDPLDTSELAVRGLNGYTHVMVYSRSLARPIAAVVGDIYHHVQLYIASRNADGADVAAVVTADGTRHPLGRPPQKKLSESIVTNFLMRPKERFIPLSRQTDLIDALDQVDADGKSRGRLGLDFGSVGLCHVAAGFTDAVIEFAKGFAIWDLAPGHYILDAAGGTVLDLQGEPVSLDYGLNSLDDIATAMDPRQKFVAAGTVELAQEIVRALRS